MEEAILTIGWFRKRHARVVRGNSSRWTYVATGRKCLFHDKLEKARDREYFKRMRAKFTNQEWLPTSSLPEAKVVK